MLKVSIITVCLNEEKRIEDTIRSIINQTYKKFELIVVDGGSTDETLNILNRYSKHIDVFLPNHGDGVYKAMNAGIASSTGDYIYFMNGGDRFMKNDVLSRILVDSPNEDILYGNILIKDINGGSRIKTPPPFANVDYLTYRTIPHQSSLTRKSLFMDIGLFDETYLIAADYEFFMRAIVNHSVTTLYFPFTFAVWIEDGISSLDTHIHLCQSERKRAQKRNLPYYYYLIARKRYYYPPNNKSFIVNKISRYKKLIFKLFR